MKKSLPSVHVLCPNRPLQCMTYLIDGPNEAILVDPGSGVAETTILQGIRRVGRTLAQVQYALLTHCHADHALGAYRFQGRGVKLVSSPRAAELLGRGSHQVWYEDPHHVVPTDVDITPADGEVLHLCGMEIRVIHTPGHTGGSVAYLVETDCGLTAFTGDTYTACGHVGFAGSEDFSEEQTLATLRRLLALSPDHVCTGHGVVAGSATRWLEDAVADGRAGRWMLR